MSTASGSKAFTSRLRDLAAGLLAWFVGFLLYLVPGLYVGLSMGFDLGPRLQDNAEVSRLISEAVSGMYQSSPYLHYGYILVVALSVLWRSRAAARRSQGRSIVTGVLVAAVPLVLTALPFAWGGHLLMGAIAAVTVLSAGVIGSRLAGPGGSPH